MILLSVLQSEDNLEWLTPGPSHPDSLDSTRRAIYAWIEKIACSDPTIEERTDTHRDLREMLWQSKHCRLVAHLSARYFNFFKIHFGFLVSKTEELHLEVQFDSEKSPTAIAIQEEEWVISHWVELAMAGEVTRETCISFLQSRAWNVVLHAITSLSLNKQQSLK